MMNRFLIKKRKLSEEFPGQNNAHRVDVEELPGPSFNPPNVEMSKVVAKMDKKKYSAYKASIKILKADESENDFAGFDINDELLPYIENKKKYILDICTEETGKSIEACAPLNGSFNVLKNYDKKSSQKSSKVVAKMDEKKYSAYKASIKISKADESENDFAGFDINDELLPYIENKKKYILDICTEETGKSIEACAPLNGSFNVLKNYDKKSQSKLQERHNDMVSMESLNYFVASMNHVFKYLTMYEIMSASRVSTTWNIIAMNKELWQTVRLKNCKVINWKKCIEVIDNHGSIGLDIRRMLMPTEIKELKTFWSKFVLAINEAQKLKHIELYTCPANVVERTIFSLTQLTVLNATSIKNLNVKNDNKSKMLMTLDLTYLCHMVQLSELRLKGLSGIKLTYLPSFEKLVNLKYLAITSIEAFPKNICCSLETITTDLQFFEIGDCCCLPNNFAGVLKRFSNLISLRLENCYDIWKKDAQAVFCSIRGLDKLKILELINIEINNSVKKELEKCHGIKALLIIPAYFIECSVTNSNLLDCLKKLSNTLSHLVWGIDEMLITSTDSLISAHNKNKLMCQLELHNSEETKNNIPILRKIKPGEEFPTEEDKKKDETLYMFPVPALEKLLDTTLKFKSKVIKVPHLKTNHVYLTQYFNDI